MSKAGKLVKGLLKTKKESVMGKLGDAPYEDPMDQWSVKYNQPVKNEEVQIDEGAFSSGALKPSKEFEKQAAKVPSSGTVRGKDSKGVYTAKTVNGKEVSRVYEEAEELQEDSWLFSYIRSLGYNPKIMNFAQRSKYARSNAFKHWKQSHMERRAGQTAAMEATDMCNVCGQTPCNCTHIEEGRLSWKTVHKEPIPGNKYGHVVVKEPSNTQTHAYAVHLSHEPISSSKYGFSDKESAINHAKRLAAKYAKPQNEEVEQIDEAGTGLLMTYIKAKGLNPLTMDGNQKHAYARSSEFKIFKQKHHKVKKEEFERLVNTYGSENLAELVMSVQETSGMGERGDDWNEESVPKIKKKKLKKALKRLKEELDKADTITMDIPLLIRVLEYAREDAKTDMDLHKVVENLIKMRDEGTLSMAQYDAIVKIKEDIERLQELKKMPDNMDAEDHITREEKQMKGKDPCWKGYQMVGTKKKSGRTVPNCVPEQVQEGIGGIEDSPLSATNSVKAMESAHRSRQMKSARMIKSIYKNKLKKENLYDWEKDDKPNAKIVIKGGTTMTGQPRDTVEIEPVLKTRPNSAKPTN